jgi:hypothetical protein
MTFRATVLIAGGLLLAGCNGASRATPSIDPNRDACSRACQIDSSHHCFKWTIADSSGTKLSARDHCRKLCQEKAGEADARYRRGCGACVAQGAQYVVKPEPYCQTGKREVTCCWGVAMTRLPTTPVCVPACLGPDGGTD